MRNEVSYEWTVEHYADDEYQDIHHCDHILLNQWPIAPVNGLSVRLLLKRYCGNDEEGTLSIGHAYFDSDQLEAHFDTGQKVPATYRKSSKGKSQRNVPVGIE